MSHHSVYEIKGLAFVKQYLSLPLLPQFEAKIISK